MNSFSYQTHAVKVLFNQPIIKAIGDQIPSTAKKIGLIASKRFDNLAKEINNLSQVEQVVHFSEVTQHVPQSLVETAVSFFWENPVDIMLCVGGGSAVGLGKAVVLQVDAQLWAAPTTYSGSEMTNIYGISADGVKTVKRDDRVHPKVVIYDPSLSSNLPLSVALPSAFNALAHLIEAVYSIESNPITQSLTKLGIETILRALHQIKTVGVLDSTAHSDLLFGAYVGGKILCEVSMGLHHKAAHVLGGNFNLEHAHIHTLLLPYVMEYQWPFLKENQKSIYQEVFQAENPAKELRTLQESLGYGFRLEQLGFTNSQIPQAVTYLMQMNYPNPAPLDEKRLSEMLEKAL